MAKDINKISNKDLDKMISKLESKIDKKGKKKKHKKKKSKEHYNFYWNKYMEELGVKRDNVDIATWSKGKTVDKLKNEYGIDYRECYNLDTSIAIYIYSRLMLYKENTITDLEYEKQDFGDFNGTLKEAIDIVLTGLRLYLADENTDKKEYLDKCKEYLSIDKVDDTFKYMAKCKVFKKAMNMLAEIGPALWD